MDPSPSAYTLGRIHPSKTIHAFFVGRTLCGIRISYARDFIPISAEVTHPTCKRCLELLRKREAAPFSAATTPITTSVPPNMMPSSFLAWEETMDHLFGAMRRQVAQLGTLDATPALTLEFTLLPLLRRYMLGDRSPELYQSIWQLDRS